MGIEGEEGAEAVVVGPIQQQVREQGDEGAEEKPGEAEGGFGGAGSQAMIEVEGGGDEGGFYGHGEESVGNAAVVLEGGERAAEAPEGVDIGQLGGDDHGEGGVGGPAIEAGAGKDGAGEEVGYGFHDYSM